MLDQFEEGLWPGLAIMALFGGALALGWQLAKVSVLLALVYAPIALVLVGALGRMVLRLFPRERTRVEVMALLQGFLDGTATAADWRFFTGRRIADPRLEAMLDVYPRTLRFRCLTVFDTEQRESLASALCTVTDTEVPTLRSPKTSGVMAAVGRGTAANAEAEP